MVLLLFDAARAHAHGRMLSRRELGLAGAALDEGKALLLVANKADLLQPEQLQELLDSVTGTLERMFLVAGRLPVVALSALQVRGGRCGRREALLLLLWRRRALRAAGAREPRPQTRRLLLLQPERDAAADPTARPRPRPRPAGRRD